MAPSRQETAATTARVAGTEAAGFGLTWLASKATQFALQAEGAIDLKAGNTAGLQSSLEASGKAVDWHETVLNLSRYLDHPIVHTAQLLGLVGLAAGEIVKPDATESQSRLADIRRAIYTIGIVAAPESLTRLINHTAGVLDPVAVGIGATAAIHTGVNLWRAHDLRRRDARTAKIDEMHSRNLNPRIGNKPLLKDEDFRLPVGKRINELKRVAQAARDHFSHSVNARIAQTENERASADTIFSGSSQTQPEGESRFEQIHKELANGTRKPNPNRGSKTK